jgi:type I restriction-modification system DNA methylase subunit
VATATHDERLGALRSVLQGCGYADREIAERFPIWLPGQDVIRPDYVAFTHPDQRDMSTSAIVAQVVDGHDDIWNRWLPAATALAAPAVLIALPDRIAVWSSGIDRVETREVMSGPVSAPVSIANRMRMLTPKAISRAKSHGFERSLFPVDLDLLEASRQRARSYLTEQVEAALVALGGVNDPRADELVPKLVVGALATLMIRDKTDYNHLDYYSAGALIDTAQQQFANYFDWLSDLTKQQFNLFSNLVDDLGSNINFAALEPAMVADVYEQALFTKLQRREQGAYYTPPQLADQILKVIPLEHLEPDRRLILDPACGSGTMLLSAAKRLTQLQATQVDYRQWHTYLTSHLRGFDNDPFATEITKLCLLMTALPIGNHWQVDTIDTLDVELSTDERPNIIISNPPWGFHRDPAGSTERANLFLSWMLSNLSNDGFLACVMPLSWLNRNNSRDSRDSLLQGATLLEAWRLPSSLFQNTRPTTAPAVIIAQKTKGGHPQGRVTLVKTVRDSSLTYFLSHGIADEAYLVEPGKSGERLTFGPLSRAISALTGFTSIGQISEIRNGRPAKPGRLPRSLQDATHDELGSLRALYAFSPVDPSLLTPVRYPEDYDSANPSDERVRAHKVIVTAKNFVTRNPWRINVGYDQHGVALREMFHMIIPNEQWRPWADFSEMDRFYALMAVLGSGMASALIDEHEPTRNISTRRIASIPFPSDTDSIRILASVGQEVSEAITSGERDSIYYALRTLETAVSIIYRLPPDAQEVIAKRLAGAPGFDGTIRYPARIKDSGKFSQDRTSFGLPSFGQVLSAEEGGLRLWISGVTEAEGTDVPAPPQIPGWLCEKGSDFRVEGDLSNLQNAYFGFHSYDWLTEDDLTRPGSAQ